MKQRSTALVALLAVCMLAAGEARADITQENKDVAVAFFRMMFQDKHVEQAVNRYVGPVYVQHDPYLSDGAGSMADFYLSYFDRHPLASAEIRRVVAEGDMVVIHNLWKASPDDAGRAVVDMFRVRHGRIVEHWDVGQSIPDSCANRNGML